MHKVGIYSFSVALATIGLGIAPAHAGEAGYTASVEGFGGITDNSQRTDRPTSDFSGGVSGSVAFPVHGPLTVQADGLGAGHRRDNAAGAALHLGGTIGGVAYVGAYGDYATVGESGGVDGWRIGGELRFSAGPVTISGVAGVEDVDQVSNVFDVTNLATITDLYGRDSDFFDMVDVRYDLNGKGSLFVGHRYVGGAHAAAFGGEYGISQRISLFAEGRLGEGDYNAGWVGVRIRFGRQDEGGQGSLLTNRLKDSILGATNSRSRISVPLPPPESECSGYSCDVD